MRVSTTINLRSQRWLFLLVVALSSVAFALTDAERQVCALNDGAVGGASC